MTKKNVTLTTQGSYIIVDNGLVRLTISKPQGLLTAIKYGGIDNLLDIQSNELSRGYWDINWNLPGGQDRYLLFRGSEYSVINFSNDHLEVSFKTTYDPSVRGTKLPLTVDQRYIVRSGVSGFYCYAIYERPPGCPAFDLAQTRMVFKFHYMAITDEKQRIMPMPEDLLPNRGKQLIVPESVLLINPINPDLKGEVDDKYQYSMDNKDGGVHGWISSIPLLDSGSSSPAMNFERLMEESLWPYEFISSPYYLTYKERGSVTGRLFVHDRYVSASFFLLSLHSLVCQLQELKALGKLKASSSSGSETQLGNINYVPPRNGPTLWEIGFPDRTANDYYVPDVNPMYVNKLFLHSPEKQYGLWDRYTDIYPKSDQVFTIGISDPKKDWFFAHVDRKNGDKYVPTTWEIRFNITTVAVHVNQMNAEQLVFQVTNLGADNTVCRHGIHGLYQLLSVDITSTLLTTGDNCIFLSQARGGDALCGILYDYIRLEAPPA
ncbi:hypothetical protein DH2020_032987 [Rehmannia glutinosa]|uniref:Rhamnogalacturonan lyase domain-containing protein n=1 Tax=Rehmannia glutinosa TaxID=99300 RepID=A0ABR0VGF8_REHGL